MSHSNSKVRSTLIILVLLALSYIGVQSFIAYQYADLSEKTESRFKAIQTSSIDERKKLEEAIALGIENSRKKLFWATFVTNISATIGILVAFASIWVGFRQYIQTQEKQQQERSKERRDRIAIELNTLWQGITCPDTNTRAGCAAALQDLLDKDKAEFHRRVASALALLGRLPSDESVLQVTLRPVIEHAMKTLDPSILCSVSWQWLVLKQPDFRGAKLPGIDLRDCDLQEADFSEADLRGARFNAACLKGARFDGADLSDADLEYADLAGASFRQANLQKANLSDIKLLDADLYGADVSGSELSWSKIDITHAKNWRQATMAREVKAALLAEHGPGPEGRRVLMLMWEMEPIVSGGGWTAAFHFVRNLSRRGADLTIMVPWIDSPVSRSIFGNEVTFVPVGIRLPRKTTGVYNMQSPDAHSQYSAQAHSSYADEDGSAYAYTYGGSHTEIVNQFTRRALEWVKAHTADYDLVHAHDWLTFKAAALIATHLKTPWIGHFHSIESERRKKPARWISQVEAEAIDQAEAIVAPSKVTRGHITARYPAVAEKLHVVPNCLSEARSHLGRVVSLDPGLVVFVGRRSWQKGPDRFVRIARAIQKLRPQTRFDMYGRDDRLSPFLYGAYGAYQGPVETDVDGLVKKTRPKEHPHYLEPMDTEDIEMGLKMIADIQPAQIRDLQVFPIEERLSPEEAEAAKTDLLKSGAILLPYKSKDNNYTHVAFQDEATGLAVSDQVYLVEADGLSAIAYKDDSEHIVLKDFIPWQRRFETFRDAAVLVVPSRHEPFGMIVLEAMQAGVAVFVAEQAGVNEVIGSVKTIDPQQVVPTAKQIVALLRDQDLWSRQVQAQQKEVAAYHERGYEDRLIELWDQLCTTEEEAPPPA